MCAAHEPHVVGGATFEEFLQEQRAAACAIRWEILLHGARWLRFLRRAWGLFGNFVKPLPRTQYARQRKWWGEFGIELREIKARGRRAVEGPPAPPPGPHQPAAAPTAEPDEEPETEPIHVTSVPLEAVAAHGVQVTFNVNINNAATTVAGSEGGGRGRGAEAPAGRGSARPRGRGRGR